MTYISGMVTKETNLHCTICLVEIPLSKDIKSISVVTMTFAKNRKMIFGLNKDFQGHSWCF